MLEQQPLVPFRRSPFDLDQRPLAEHLLAVESKREFALLHRFYRIIPWLDELPLPGIPDDHVSGAVISFGDDALE